MRYDPDELNRWKRRRLFASFVTGVGLLVQTVGPRFGRSDAGILLHGVVTVTTLAAALVACYYWYRLKQLPVTA